MTIPPRSSLVSSLVGLALLALVGCATSDTAVPASSGTDGAPPARADAGSSPPTQPDASVDRPDAEHRYEGESYTGIVTSFPLPATREVPHSTSHGSKHTNLASDGTRLYVTGGDWLHSATDGTWSMDLVDGSWRMEVGEPIHPTRPAPHALQDGAGFAWSAARSKFLVWPGSYFAYDEPGSPLLEYARGAWWLDPVTREFTHEPGLFGEPGSGSGNLYGGIYDDVNDHIVTFGDSSSGLSVNRWDVGTLTKLEPIAFELEMDEWTAAYFAYGMHVKIDRTVYILGVRTNGEVESQTPLFLAWDLDAHTMVELPPPPVDGSRVETIEIRMGASHGKVVWPFVRGPEGEIDSIYVYVPSRAQWYRDDQVPDYGAFIGNALASLPDQRVVFTGGEFGRQQTHIWFYEAP